MAARAITPAGPIALPPSCTTSGPGSVIRPGEKYTHGGSTELGAECRSVRETEKWASCRIRPRPCVSWASVADSLTALEIWQPHPPQFQRGSNRTDQDHVWASYWWVASTIGSDTTISTGCPPPDARRLHACRRRRDIVDLVLRCGAARPGRRSSVPVHRARRCETGNSNCHFPPQRSARNWQRSHDRRDAPERETVRSWLHPRWDGGRRAHAAASPRRVCYPRPTISRSPCVLRRARSGAVAG